MATTSIGSSGVTFPDSTVQATKGLTSLAAGTGISVSGNTITNTAPNSTSFNTVGSYCFGRIANSQPSSGSNYSAGGSGGQATSAVIYGDCSLVVYSSNNLSGTWKWMSGSGYPAGVSNQGIMCRVS